MRITDVALSTSTPVGTSRTAAKRSEQEGKAPTVVGYRAPDGAQHPDEVAASKLQQAAAAAQATRVVAAENQRASESVRGEISLDRVVVAG